MEGTALGLDLIRARLAAHPLHEATLARGLARDLDAVTVDDPESPPLSGRAEDLRVRGDHDLNPDLVPDGHVRAAAVLVPLIPRPGGLTLLLTRRTAHLPRHPGQISFPGGRMEPEDRSLVETALRETEEEIGIPRAAIQPIGRLDRYLIARTGYSVTPIVGVIDASASFRPDPGEVAEVFEVPLAGLMAPGAGRQEHRTFEGETRSFHVFEHEGRRIWGATAGMILNLREALVGGEGDG